MKKFYLFVGVSTIIQSKAQWTQIGFMALTPDTATNVTRFEGFGSNMYAATNKGIFKSTDDGTNWSAISWSAAVTQTQSMLSVYEESTSVIYAGSDKWLFKSTNSGSSWTKLTLPKDSVTISDIKRSGSNMVVAYSKGSTKGGVFYSNDNGGNWLAAAGIPTANTMNDLHVEGDTVYVAGKGGIYKSTNKGVNFSFLGNGSNIGLRSILRHQGKLFAGDGGGTGLYMSANNGGTFTPANMTVFGGFCQVFSIAQSPAMILASVDGGTNCNNGDPIKSSSDGGSGWSPFMTGLPTGFYASLGTNSSESSFFTSKGKLIYRIGTPAGIKDHTMNNNLSAYFDQDNNLLVHVHNNTNIIVSIYSLNGEKVYETETSESDIRISGLKDYAPGIYLIRLSSGEKMISGKVIKTN